VALKSLIKTVARIVAVCCVAPLALTERVARRFLHRDVFFEAQGELLSKTGCYLRNAYYWMILETCPFDCCFVFGSIFTHSTAKIGHCVYIGSFSRVGSASIGDSSMLGDHVHVLSGNEQHSFADPGRTIQDGPQSFLHIEIGANCWIGSSSVVMANVGRDCVIGAGSVVTKAIPDNSVAVGNPARIIREVYSHRPRAHSRPRFNSHSRATSEGQSLEDLVISEGRRPGSDDQ
jgi:virginiamycin A acetyltransferase